MKYIRIIFSCCLIINGIQAIGASLDKENMNIKPGKDNMTIALIGASYVKGWHVSELAGMKVINKGIAGETTDKINKRFIKDVIDIRPNVVIVWGFINDIFNTDRKYIEEKLTGTKKSIKEMLDLARKNHIIPVLATEPPITYEQSFKSSFLSFFYELFNKPSYQSYVNNRVYEMNKWIREVTINEKITLLDYQTLLESNSGFRKKMYATDDGVHISNAGYEKITSYTNMILDEHL